MRRIYTILWVIFLFCACYDDKGNYNYRDIDELEITFPGSTGTDGKVIYVGKIGDILSITPKLNYADTNHLVYAWTRYTTPTGVTLDTLAMTKNLEMEISADEEAAHRWKTGKHLLKYSIEDTVSKQTVHVMVNLVVRSLHPTGVYILHGGNTEADVATLENNDFIEGMETPVCNMNYYSSVRGEKLDGEGRSIAWFSIFGTQGLLVFTDHDGSYIDPTSFREEADLKTMFGGTVPAGLDIKRLVIFQHQGISALYTSSKTYFLGDVSEPEIEEIYGVDNMGGKIPGYFYSDAGSTQNDYGTGYLGYSEAKASFFIYDPYSSADLVNPCPDDPYGGVWEPGNMGTQQMIGIDYGVISSSWYEYIQQHWAAFKDEQGNIKVYRFNPGASEEEEPKPMYDLATAIAGSSKNPELMELNCFSMSQLATSLGYFSTPDAVYSLDIVNNPDISEVFRPESGAEKITMIKLLKYPNLEDLKEVNEIFHSRLSLSLYVVTWDGVQGRLYRVPVDEEGGVDGDREIEKFEGFGQIRDMTFRLQ